MEKISLQLDHYFYPKINIRADSSYRASKEESAPRINIEKKFECLNEAERVWVVNLTLKTISKEKGSFPYNIELQVVGFFKVAPDYPQHEIEKLIQIGGSSILYSASRDFVLTITSRGPWGPVFLPSVTFTKKTENKESTSDEGS